MIGHSSFLLQLTTLVCSHPFGNNQDKCAINERIFLEHLKYTHNTEMNVMPPFHTIVVMASNLKLHVSKRRCRNMPELQKNILLTCCSDANVTSGGSKRIDPMLKLCVGCPLIINDNINVENKIANGSMATFMNVKLKNGFKDCFTINIHGHYVRCVEATDVEHIEVMLEGDSSANNVRRIEISKMTAIAMFPDVEDIMTASTGSPQRRQKQIQLCQFPLNVADARTVHKLQGKSLENLLVSNWSHTTNWVHVVLSRVKTSNGLFLRIPLDHNKLNSRETINLRNKTKSFLQFFKQTKKLINSINGNNTNGN